jgi:peptide chain release factor 1
MFGKLEKVKERYYEIAELLNKPETALNQREFRKLSKEYSDLTEIVQKYNEYNKVKLGVEENRKLLYETNDAELKEMAKAEQESLEAKVTELETQIKDLLVPKDPNDSKNAILEIRAGTGGEEAALFAADLYRMYTRFAEKKGWKMDLMTFNESSGLGGLKRRPSCAARTANRNTGKDAYFGCIGCCTSRSR